MSLISLERISSEHVLHDGVSTNKVLLDNSLEYRRSDGVIPHAVRIDHGDRAMLADAQAIGFCSQDAVIAVG